MVDHGIPWSPGHHFHLGTARWYSAQGPVIRRKGRWSEVIVYLLYIYYIYINET